MATPTQPELGRPTSTHGISPVYLQRGAIVAALSFLFFLTGMLLFYIQQSIVFFVLASAFLIVYVFTMIGWVLQKKNVVTVYENGLTYRNFRTTWEELQSVSSSAGTGIKLVKDNGETVTIGKTLADFDKVAVEIRKHLS